MPMFNISSQVGFAARIDLKRVQSTRQKRGNVSQAVIARQTVTN
jgi:hypothetical protein